MKILEIFKKFFNAFNKSKNSLCSRKFVTESILNLYVRVYVSYFVHKCNTSQDCTVQLLFLRVRFYLYEIRVFNVFALQILLVFCWFLICQHFVDFKIYFSKHGFESHRGLNLFFTIHSIL